METESDNFNDRLDKAMGILESDPALQDDQDTTATNANASAGDGNAEPPKKDAIGEEQKNPNETDKAKPTDKSAIEPPASWSSDDKAAFSNLPEWAQQTIARRESEREAHFSERSRVIAAREQELNSLNMRTQQEQQQYAANLERATQLVQQLMPAKFSDIQSQADYLRVKMEDPQRAAEYEVFTQLMRDMGMQREQTQKAQLQQKLDKEWETLQVKYPEFKDTQKAQTILDEVRKAAVEYYGFTPQEMETIPDHRHVPILRDALAWRKHLANVKAAESKRVPVSPTAPALRANAAGTGANLNAEQRNKILNRAGSTNDLRKKADILASLIA